MQQFRTCLWFDDQAEEAAKFYVSIFKNSKIESIAHYGEESSKGANRPKGSVMVVTFELNGQQFMGLNGGPLFKFSEAISIVVNCETQQEIDYYWEKLLAGGSESACGWLKDKYGLSWQIVPSKIGEWLSDKTPKKSEAVMKEVMQMVKLDIARMKAAYDRA